MGIENTALETIISLNQSLMNSPERCVRFSCEKRRYTRQRQPAPPWLTSTPIPTLNAAHNRSISAPPRNILRLIANLLGLTVA